MKGSNSAEAKQCLLDGSKSGPNRDASISIFTNHSGWLQLSMYSICSSDIQQNIAAEGGKWPPFLLFPLLISDYHLNQWFLSFFERNPKSGLNQKLTTQALTYQAFLKTFV